jgi:predicted aminopeptidase
MRRLLLPAPLLLAGCYLLTQAGRQLEILHNREAVDDVLARGALRDDAARKLRLVADAKEFGETVMGLTKSDNYTTFYDTRGRAVSYVVSACRKDRFAAHAWWFPIVGTLPYKGFFSLDDARAEARGLEALGYDVTVRQVAAYSTLGWFSDPVFSTMLRHDDADLVALILHELTHGTVFATGHADWNEAMASFVGQEGAVQFLRRRDEALATRAAERFADEMKVDAFAKRAADRLARLYGSGRPEAEVLILREQLWAEAREEFQSFRRTLHRPEEFDHEFRGRVNNADVQARLRYGRYDVFATAWEACGRDWTRFFAKMREAAAAEDPWRVLR